MTTILGAGFLALFVTLIFTKFFIRRLRRKQYGQYVRDDGPTTHKTKRGTPTMGGVIIVVAVVFAYFLAHLITWVPPSLSGLLILGLLVSTAILGFLDDWAKISNQRSLGLSPRGKLIGQGLIGVVFGLASLNFPDGRGVTPASSAISFTRDIEWLRMPLVVAIVWMTLLITAASNAVKPCSSMCRKMFSLITTASSITTPMARISPSMVMLFRVYPIQYMKAYVAMMEVGMARLAMIVVRQSWMNSRIVRATRIAAITRWKFSS